MAEEELTELVVANDSGKDGFPRDDALRAVPSDARHDGCMNQKDAKSGIQ